MKQFSTLNSDVSELKEKIAMDNRRIPSSIEESAEVFLNSMIIEKRPKNA